MRISAILESQSGETGVSCLRVAVLWHVGCGRPPPRCTQSTQHSHTTEHMSIFNRTSGSPCGLCVMQFDVPNPHISNSQSTGRGAVGPAPPRTGCRYLGRYVCGLCVLRGYGTRHANTARVRRRVNDTTEPHTRSRTRVTAYHAVAQACAPEASAC
jgi:hypothetical protein